MAQMEVGRKRDAAGGPKLTLVARGVGFGWVSRVRAAIDMRPTSDRCAPAAGPKSLLGPRPVFQHERGR